MWYSNSILGSWNSHWYVDFCELTSKIWMSSWIPGRFRIAMAMASGSKGLKTCYMATWRQHWCVRNWSTKKNAKNNAAMMCNYIIQTSSTVVLTFLLLTTTSPQCWSCFNAVVALAISGLPLDPLAVAGSFGVNNRNTIGKKGLSPRNMGFSG